MEPVRRDPFDADNGISPRGIGDYIVPHADMGIPEWRDRARIERLNLQVLDWLAESALAFCLDQAAIDIKKKKKPSA